jgi:hypothetical protein
MLTRGDFLSNNLKCELVEVPELDGSVYVRELSARQLMLFRDRVEVLQKVNPELTVSSGLELMALVLSLSVCDESGTPLFTEADANGLADGKFSVLLNLSTKAMEMSGISSALASGVAVDLKNARTSSSATSLPTN